MWRSKKFIFTVLLTVVVLGGILGGVAVARADDENTDQPQITRLNIMDKIAEIYEQKTGVAINSDKLQESFNEARIAVANDARDQFLQKLVEEGKITQGQLDEFEKWLAERPDFPTDEYQQWLESRPDIPFFFGQDNHRGMMPFGGMPRGFRDFGKGFGGMFRGWCPPEAPAE
jgi:hypothetical protein